MIPAGPNQQQKLQQHEIQQHQLKLQQLAYQQQQQQQHQQQLHYQNQGIPSDNIHQNGSYNVHQYYDQPIQQHLNHKQLQSHQHQLQQKQQQYENYLYQQHLAKHQEQFLHQARQQQQNNIKMEHLHQDEQCLGKQQQLPSSSYPPPSLLVDEAIVQVASTAGVDVSKVEKRSEKTIIVQKTKKIKKAVPPTSLHFQRQSSQSSTLCEQQSSTPSTQSSTTEPSQQTNPRPGPQKQEKTLPPPSPRPQLPQQNYHIYQKQQQFHNQNPNYHHQQFQADTHPPPQNLASPPLDQHLQSLMVMMPNTPEQQPSVEEMLQFQQQMKQQQQLQLEMRQKQQHQYQQLQYQQQQYEQQQMQHLQTPKQHIFPVNGMNSEDSQDASNQGSSNTSGSSKASGKQNQLTPFELHLQIRAKKSKLLVEDKIITQQLPQVLQQENRSKVGFFISLSSSSSYFKFNKSKPQTIGVIVSVKTALIGGSCSRGGGSDSSSAPEPVRPSVDLVCVIDNSGSMSGRKMDNVKTTLKFLLEVMNDNDRISLIVFNTNSTVLSHLIRTTLQNKHILTKTIEEIYATGRTDIFSGMNDALDVLEQRQTRNQVTSIFLLSDGVDEKINGEPMPRISERFDRFRENEKLTIHSFGFGNDHDSELMTNIAQLAGGNFYFVQQINTLSEYFAHALGGLFSVVAQDVKISLSLQNNQPRFKQFFEGMTVSKVYSNQVAISKYRDQFQARVNQLMGGVTKDFIFELTIPPKDVSDIQQEQRNAVIAIAQLLAVSVKVGSAPQTTEELACLRLKLLKEDEETPIEEKNVNFEFHYARVRAMEALHKANRLAEIDQHSAGIKLLKDVIAIIDNIGLPTDQNLIGLKEDLLQCQKNLYSQAGRSHNFAKISLLNNQTAQPETSRENKFASQFQKDLVDLAKSKNPNKFF